MNLQDFEEDMPLRHSRVIWALVAGVALAVIWALVYEIDEVARGPGTVIASNRVQVIQAVDGGVLQSLAVREGARVEKGQVLATLDRTRFAAGVRELEIKVSGLSAQAARLRAEVLEQSSVEFPPHLDAHPEQVALQKALFSQRRQAIREELRTLAVAADLARQDAQLVAELARNGDVSQSEVIRSRKAQNDAEAALINRRNKYLQDARAELAKIEDEMGQVDQQRTQRQQQLDDSVLVALVPGTVKNVRVTTIGGVLKGGEELMQIVPADDVLIVEAKFTPADIARLKPGLPTSVRFDSFDYTVFGAVDGEVSYVSADTLKEETRNGETVYYRVHVSIPGNPVTSRAGKTLDILPGMTAQVDVRTGRRSVMDYLLKPLRKTLSESLGER